MIDGYGIPGKFTTKNTTTPTTTSEYIQGKGSPTDKSPFTKDDPYTGPMPLGNPNTGKGNLFFEIVDSIVHGTPPDDIKSPFGREDYSSPAPITLLGDDAIKELTQDQARAELKKIGPTVSGSAGDYSDLSTFDSYNFGSSPYDLDYFKKLAEAAGGGKKTQSASDLNVIHGAGANTFRYDPDNPPEDEGEGVDNGGGGGDSGGGTAPIDYTLKKPTPYVTPLPTDFDYGFSGITPPQQVTTQMPASSTIVPPTSQYTASMLSQATPTLSSEQLMGLGTDEEQTLAEYLALLDNADSVG
jgi:hypothetical protein